MLYPACCCLKSFPGICPCSGVDKLHAAPAAAAARSHGEALARPEQQYLSYDSATKAAHQAWQAPEEKDWRKVLTAKKHRAANKSLIEEAEREQAAKLIQAGLTAESSVKLGTFRVASLPHGFSGLCKDCLSCSCP